MRLSHLIAVISVAVSQVTAFEARAKFQMSPVLAGAGTKPSIVFCTNKRIEEWQFAISENGNSCYEKNCKPRIIYSVPDVYASDKPLPRFNPAGELGCQSISFRVPLNNSDGVINYKFTKKYYLVALNSVGRIVAASDKFIVSQEPHFVKRVLEPVQVAKGQKVEARWRHWFGRDAESKAKKATKLSERQAKKAAKSQADTQDNSGDVNALAGIAGSDQAGGAV